MSTEQPQLTEPQPTESQDAGAVKPETELENLPLHEIKRMCKERHPDITIKNTFKKKQLITLLITGKRPEPEVREQKRAPVMKPKESGKMIAVIPDDIKDELSRLADKGLEWEVDSESGCVNFTNGQYTSCANLDQNSNNILKTAMDCFPKSKPVEMNRHDRHPILD